MNISAGTPTTTESTQTQVNVNDSPSIQKSDKVSEPAKKEEKTEDSSKENQSDFKKLLEEPKNTDKANIEQQIPQENPNQNMINEQYINKFGFDTVQSIKNLKSMYNYDTVKISKEDAKFFVDLVDNKQFAMQQNGENTTLIKFADEIGPTYKTQQTSKVLTDLITKAYNEQKPVRVDFDNNVSVILKVDTKGKVSAEFIPGDKAVEAYLRNNIGYLKQRFDDQNLPYNDLMYRQSNNGNQNRQKQNQQKDKGE